MKAVSHISETGEQMISDENIYSIIRELISGKEEVGLFEGRGISACLDGSAK